MLGESAGREKAPGKSDVLSKNTVAGETESPSAESGKFIAGDPEADEFYNPERAAERRAAFSEHIEKVKSTLERVYKGVQIEEIDNPYLERHLQIKNEERVVLESMGLRITSPDEQRVTVGYMLTTFDLSKSIESKPENKRGVSDIEDTIRSIRFEMPKN